MIFIKYPSTVAGMKQKLSKQVSLLREFWQGLLGKKRLSDFPSPRHRPGSTGPAWLPSAGSRPSTPAGSPPSPLGLRLLFSNLSWSRRKELPPYSSLTPSAVGMVCIHLGPLYTYRFCIFQTPNHKHRVRHRLLCDFQVQEAS